MLPYLLHQLNELNDSLIASMLSCSQTCVKRPYKTRYIFGFSIAIFMSPELMVA